MSGSAFAPWAIASDDEWPQKLAKKLGWNGEGGEPACLAVLQKAPPKAIIKMQSKLTTLEDRKRFKFFSFSPVVESYESEQCFLNKLPKDLVGIAWSRHVPVLTGLCSNEGFINYKMVKKEPQIVQKDNLKSTYLFNEINVDMESEKCRELTKKLEAFYFGCNKDPKSTYLKIIHDRPFVFAIHRLITLRNKHQHAPTYLLRFDFDSTYCLPKKLFVDDNISGACHGDDTSYYFQMINHSNLAKETDEWKTIERMCEIFSTFARVGNPNNELIAPIDWKPVTFESRDQKEFSYKCLNVSNELSYIDFPEFERMLFWDEVYEN